MRYSIEPRDRIYVKEYRFFSFAINIGKNSSNKYGQKSDSRCNKKLLQKEQFKKQQKKLVI